MIVPVLTSPELLYRMLASIDHPIGTTVVIDNGRGVVSAGEVSYLTEYWCDDVYILRMPSNLGVAGSWNLGIKATPFAPWWLVANFDVVWPAGSLEGFSIVADPSGLVLSGGAPPWCAFALGEKVVQEVGLFDESLHPAYMEDDDMARRVEAAGLPIRRSTIPVHHDNSSTIRVPKFRDRNDTTFHSNAQYYAAKRSRGDLSEGRWSLRRRRELSWD